MSLKNLVKDLTPPLLIKALTNSKKNKWEGNYSSWQESLIKCKGYDDEEIFRKVTTAALAVKANKASFERDSILFYSEEYEMPILASLMYISTGENAELSVVDFGGSLGSLYYQHKKILNSRVKLKWTVVEQNHFVQFGDKNLSDSALSFRETVSLALTQQTAQTLLLSSVLQYLPDPIGILSELINYQFKFIVISRTAFIKGQSDRLTVQHVPANIYEASYPAWFFNERKFLELIYTKYELVFQFTSDDEVNIAGAYFKGFLFIKKTDNNI